MNKNHFNILILLFILTCSHTVAQTKGQFVFSYTFGLVSKGIFSVKYFPIDGYATEVHGGILPGLYNCGIAVHRYFDIQRPNTFIQIGIANFGGFPEGVNFDDSTSVDSVVSFGSTMWGINFGLGREFKSGDDIGFFAGGPTYILTRKVTYYNKRSKQSYEEEEMIGNWLGFIEGGQSHYSKK